MLAKPLCLSHNDRLTHAAHLQYVLGWLWSCVCVPLPLLVTHRYINRDDIDFATAENMTSVQEWDLQESDPQGVLEYPTQ